jgi:hypothetical protein
MTKRVVHLCSTIFKFDSSTVEAARYFEFTLRVIALTDPEDQPVINVYYLKMLIFKCDTKEQLITLNMITFNRFHCKNKYFVRQPRSQKFLKIWS